MRGGLDGYRGTSTSQRNMAATTRSKTVAKGILVLLTLKAMGSPPITVYGLTEPGSGHSPTTTHKILCSEPSVGLTREVTAMEGLREQILQAVHGVLGDRASLPDLKTLTDTMNQVNLDPSVRQLVGSVLGPSGNGETSRLPDRDRLLQAIGAMVGKLKADDRKLLEGVLDQLANSTGTMGPGAEAVRMLKGVMGGTS